LNISCPLAKLFVYGETAKYIKQISVMGLPNIIFYVDAIFFIMTSSIVVFTDPVPSLNGIMTTPF